MLKQKGYIGGFVTLVAVALLVVFVWVNSVQGQADELIGVVNTQAVFTQYLAGPLFEARDQLQAEYDEKAADMTDEEAAKLFMEYQTKLEALEMEYSNNVVEAVEKVAKVKGLEVVLDASAVLQGGIDITEDVIAALQ